MEIFKPKTPRLNGHITDHQQGVNKPDTNIEKKLVTSYLLTMLQRRSLTGC